MTDDYMKKHMEAWLKTHFRHGPELNDARRRILRFYQERENAGSYSYPEVLLYMEGDQPTWNNE